MSVSMYFHSNRIIFKLCFYFLDYFFSVFQVKFLELLHIEKFKFSHDNIKLKNYNRSKWIYLTSFEKKKKAECFK